MSNKKLIPEPVRKIKDAYWQQMNVLNGHDELDDAIDNYVSFLESQLEDKKPSRKTRIAELEAALETAREDALEEAADVCTKIIMENINIMKSDGRHINPLWVQKAAKGMVSLAREDILNLKETT
jgi:hypothetical protein